MRVRSAARAAGYPGAMSSQGRPDPQVVAALVRSVHIPGVQEGVLARLVSQSWPGGPDRANPAALDWVRRWGPSRMGSELPGCSCLAGRCATCN